MTGARDCTKDPPNLGVGAYWHAGVDLTRLISGLCQ